MALVGVRLTLPMPKTLAKPSPFVTVGVAAAMGTTYRASRMVGVGWQSFWVEGVLASRVEVQLFPRGRSPVDDGRLLMGFVLALR